MSVDLRKLAADLKARDVDIQLLALQTVGRLSGADLSAQWEVTRAVHAILAALAEGDKGDAPFLARQAIDHFKQELGADYDKVVPAAGGERGRADPRRGAPPASSATSATPAASSPSDIIEGMEALVSAAAAAQTEAAQNPGSLSLMALDAAAAQAAQAAAQEAAAAAPGAAAAGSVGSTGQTRAAGAAGAGDGAKAGAPGAALPVSLPDRASALASLASLDASDAPLMARSLLALSRAPQEGDLARCQPFLKHREPVVRSAAVAACTALVGREQITALVATLVEDREAAVRSQVLTALATAGQDVVMASLEEMLGAKAVSQRVAAVGLLGHVKSDRAIELMWKAARDPAEPVRLKLVAATLRHKHPQAREILKRLTADLNISVCEAASAAIVKAPAVPAGQGEAESTDDLAARLRSKDAEVVRSALKQVEDQRRSDVAPQVRAILAGASESVLTAHAIASLGMVGAAQDIPVIARHLTHRNDRVRANTVEALARLADPKALAPFLKPLLADKDNRVRANAVRVLAAQSADGLDDVVFQMTRSGDLPMVLSGIWASSFLPAEQAVKILEPMSREKSEEVRQKVVSALERLPSHPEVARLLRDLVRDDDISICESAQKVLERVKRGLAGTAQGGTQQTTALDAAMIAAATGTQATIVKPVDLGSLDLGDEGPSPSPGLLAAGPTAPIAPPVPPPAPPAAASPVASGESARPAVAPASAGLAKTTAIDPRQLGLDDGETIPRSTPSAKMRAVGKPGESLEDLYDKLDTELEEMGRKLARMIEMRAVLEPTLSRVHAQVKRYQEELKKQAAQAPKGFGRLLGFLGASPAEQRAQQLKLALSEELRRLGEAAVELLYSEDKRFDELEANYQAVEALLERTRELKSR